MALILVGPMAVMLLLALLMLLTPAGRQTLESMRHFPPVYAVVGDDPWLQVLGRLLVVKLRTWLMPLVVGGMASLGIVVLLHSSRSEGGGAGTPVGVSARGDAALGNSARFALLCAVTGLLATLSVEFVYLVDNFGVRANTIFKFYFQAWVLMGIASAFAVYWLSRRLSAWRTAWQVAFWLLFAAGMVYPVLGNISRAGNFEPEPTLDGTAYLAEGQADDYAAINWLNENVTDAPVILEKPGTGGSAYVYEGRVAALTGLPTLLGWGGHEGQWRGSYTIQQSREPDILTIYNSPDPTVAQALLEAYGVTYVYVGPLERSEYEPRSLDKFARFMDVAYQGGSVTIYKMRE